MLLEALELDELQHLDDALVALGATPPEELERQRDVLRDGSPVVEHRRLEDDAVVAVEPRAMRRLPVDEDLARRRLDEVADDAQERRLPAAGRADERDELAAAHLEVDVLERGDAALPERLRDPARGDDRLGDVHTSCSGARWTTSFSTSTTTRKNEIPSSAATRLTAHRFSGWSA